LKDDGGSRAVGTAASAGVMRIAQHYDAGTTRAALRPPTNDKDGGLRSGTI
jgi:hypothetical protein